MKKTFVLHDETVNTYGFRMLTDGANLEHFTSNPVMLYNHKDYDYPIGRWENIRIEGGKILADAVFNEHTEEGARVAKMVEDNFLRMASIGAWAPEEVSSDPTLMLAGQTLPTVTKWTVREASIVNIGANHYALAFYDRSTNDIIQLSDKAVLSKYISSNDDSINDKKDKKMSVLNAVLKLSDTATEQDRLNAVNSLIKNNDDLGKENKELKEKLEAKEKAEAEARKAEAVTLADAAIKEGKFDASKKDALLKMFDNDFETTKAMLEGIPARQSVADKITPPNGNTELGDLANKSWDELDKANKLIYLKDNHFEVFKEKYQAKFGREYKE